MRPQKAEPGALGEAPHERKGEEVPGRGRLPRRQRHGAETAAKPAAQKIVITTGRASRSRRVAITAPEPENTTTTSAGRPRVQSPASGLTAIRTPGKAAPAASRRTGPIVSRRRAAARTIVTSGRVKPTVVNTANGTR